ncbi:SDR family NAD(P)-dependent oxidoreductase [Kribbella sp. NPDC051952]|uniref:SDR family oxidoreductase n=1 Tax=Kribbella sp. NPDC051952 TaxID=3154851 RepID=UPI00344925BD
MARRVAVVTGGGGGIGAATCTALAREDYLVVVADRDEAKAAAVWADIAGQGLRAEAVVVDVGSSESVNKLLAATTGFGELHAVVCCAGIVHVGSVADCSDDVWSQVIDVNLTGTLRVCRAAAPLFGSSGGSITTVASIAGRTASTYSSPAYVASKAGVIGLTRALAGQLAGRGIRVNCVAPGVIETPMTATYGAERLAVLAGKIPAGRLGSAAEVADCIAFLAGPRSSYVTGQVLDVNGGQFIG